MIGTQTPLSIGASIPCLGGLSAGPAVAHRTGTTLAAGRHAALRAGRSSMATRLRRSAIAAPGGRAVTPAPPSRRASPGADACAASPSAHGPFGLPRSSGSIRAAASLRPRRRTSPLSGTAFAAISLERVTEPA